MKVSEWELYIQDYGQVYCNQPGCPDEGDWNWSPIGRRTNMGEFLKELKRHAKVDHGIHLVDNND